ncbi:hypothetical protein T310_2942 [Rasamsonia emersonii CBS 393.64]|uniref:Uncharacterized protein n=1 Tax=Rasamsonia emersonii (strain ATCC 16479 / CBS 393.64 / IMI 116815) TaxID=1408163 RepID=A0A0F4YZJ2_RASE3|nr:hypothetical protein T310_2942 [Rasamsonia emersonii CBS 393.64]KKA23063.1 hypothetical protein T310_2942 [Rasamsonia emersonii CBS 393.64]
MALGFLLDETDRVFLESCIRDGQSDFDFSLTHSPDSTGIGGEGRVLVHGQGLSCSLLAQDSIILAEYSETAKAKSRQAYGDMMGDSRVSPHSVTLRMMQRQVEKDSIDWKMHMHDNSMLERLILWLYNSGNLTRRYSDKGPRLQACVVQSISYVRLQASAPKRVAVGVGLTYYLLRSTLHQPVPAQYIQKTTESCSVETGVVEARDLGTYEQTAALSNSEKECEKPSSLHEIRAAPPFPGLELGDGPCAPTCHQRAKRQQARTESLIHEL